MEAAPAADALTPDVYRAALLDFLRVTQEFQVQCVPRAQRPVFHDAIAGLFLLRDALDDMHTTAPLPQCGHSSSTTTSSVPKMKRNGAAKREAKRSAAALHLSRSAEPAL